MNSSTPEKNRPLCPETRIQVAIPCETPPLGPSRRPRARPADPTPPPGRAPPRPPRPGQSAPRARAAQSTGIFRAPKKTVHFFVFGQYLPTTAPQEGPAQTPQRGRGALQDSQKHSTDDVFWRRSISGSSAGQETAAEPGEGSAGHGHPLPHGCVGAASPRATGRVDPRRNPSKYFFLYILYSLI